MTYSVEPLFGYSLSRRASTFDSTLALCKGKVTNDWFPEQGAGRGRRYREAKALCKRCPVQAECLKHGMETGAYGVWGGVSLHCGQPRKQSERVNARVNERNRKDEI